MKRVNYFLTLKQIERLQSLSKQTGISISEIIRRAIDEYLEKQNEKALDSTTGKRSLFSL